MAALKSLSPVLQQLTASGSDLTQSLRIAGTFPFPLGTTLEAVKGDYANLNAFVNLNLTDELCGLNKQLCNVVGKLPLTASQNSRSTSRTPRRSWTPTLIGADGSGG